MIKKFFGAYDAAEYAADIAAQWTDEEDKVYSKDQMLGFMSAADEADIVDEDDYETYYIVDEVGAIGHTTDNANSIYWIFKPVGAPAAVPVSEPQQYAPVAAPAPASGKFCINCGSPLQPGMKFCTNCGTPVRQEEKKAPVCSNCGAPLNPGTKFCTNCGTPMQMAASSPSPAPNNAAAPQAVTPLSQAHPSRGGKVGWSTVPDTVEFQNAVQMQKKANRGCAIYFVLAPVVIAPIYGLIVEGTDNFLMYLGIGAAISVVFFLFMGIDAFKQRFGKSWEGTVTDKYEDEVYVSKHSHSEESKEDAYEIRKFTIIRRDDGKKEKINERRNEAKVYRYFKVGDRVRYHAQIGGVFPYEKYDTSNDSEIVCTFCGHRAPITEDHCPKCHNPLLK